MANTWEMKTRSSPPRCSTEMTMAVRSSWMFFKSTSEPAKDFLQYGLCTLNGEA